jgi:hypothetical protein
MGAIDAHHVHSGEQQIMHQPRIRCRLAGHGDHDAHEAVGGLRPEQRSRVIPQQQRTGMEIDRGFGRGTKAPAGELLQDRHHRVEARHGVRLEYAERRQAQGTEILLQAADVVLADAEVMEEVAGASAMARFDLPQFRCVRLLKLAGAVAQGAELSHQSLQLARRELRAFRGHCGSPGWSGGGAPRPRRGVYEAIVSAT